MRNFENKFDRMMAEIKASLAEMERLYNQEYEWNVELQRENRALKPRDPNARNPNESWKEYRKKLIALKMKQLIPDFSNTVILN